MALWSSALFMVQTRKEDQRQMKNSEFRGVFFFFLLKDGCIANMSGNGLPAASQLAQLTVEAITPPLSGR